MWIRTAQLTLSVIALSFLCVAENASAQSVGFAEAVDRLAVSCRADIDKFCKKVGLGGGRIQRCLDQNAAGISPGCKGTVNELRNLLHTRAQARAAVPKACERDIMRLCSGVQPRDGNLMECFYKARRNVSPQCQKMISDAGYDVTLAPTAASDQVALDSRNMLDSLHSVEAAAATISAASLRQLAAQGMRDPSRASRMNREPLSDQLGKLAQFTIAIRFDFDSARIHPDSFRAVGLMADALNHPYLQNDRFLIIGHTDGKGNREYNLKLSQQRADAIREALINPFGISAARIETVGLGEEQLLNRGNPDAAENRRVQLINIGPAR